MANPYAVKPANFLPGFQALSEGFASRADYLKTQALEQKTLKETQEKEAVINAKREEAGRLIEFGSPEEIAKFSVKNPSYKESLYEALGFIDKQEKNELIKDTMAVLNGPESPSFYALKRAETRAKEGKDITHDLSFVEKAQQDPVKSKKDAEKTLAMLDPKAYEQYSKATGKTEPSKKQKTGAFLVRKHDGSQGIATGVFDPETGKLTTATGDIEGEVISPLGETGAEQTSRKVDEQRLSVRATGEEGRASGLISRGVAAAESTATLRRGIELLDMIDTGGYEAAALATKRLFGIESADEGELSNTLAKSVLSQLRETFGAAFTENEGKRLERIEAGFGKSAAANKRLLKQALRIATKTAKRARASALKRKDRETVEDIDDLLDFSLSIPSQSEDNANQAAIPTALPLPRQVQPGQQPQQQATPLSRMTDQQLIESLYGSR
jgi:hypothetical protein